MKKLMSFIFKLAAVAGFFAGLYYLYENFFKKENSDENMDESDFDDFDFDDEDFTETVSDEREYVTLNASESRTLQEDDADVDEDDFE